MSRRFVSSMSGALRRCVAASSTAAMIAVICLSGRARAEPAIKLTYEPQVIDVGTNPVLFSASAFFTVSVHNIQADGEIVLQSSDGESLTAQIVAARQLAGGTAQSGKPLLIIAEDVEGDPLRPPVDRFVLAVVLPDATEVGCDIWILTGSCYCTDGIQDVTFLADSTRSRVRHNFPRHDFGQIPVAASVFAPPQTVEPIEREDPLDFGAFVGIGVDNRAAGVIYAPLPEQGARYRCCFGAVFPHEELGYQLFLVGALPGATDTDGLLRATVSPLPRDSDRQHWDLLGGSGPPPEHTAQFDAETFVVFP